MENFTEVQGRFFALNSFFRSYYSFEALGDICNDYDSVYQSLNPFTHIHNVLLCDAVISWCKVFGSNKEECHWKNLISDHQAFRDRLFSELNITQKEFAAYQSKVLDFRNKWVVHYEPSYKHDVVPHFDLMLKSAVILHTFLRENVSDEFIYNGPVSIEGFGRSVGMAIMDSLKPIDQT
ncbi:hypothetical protein [Vibrio owensii]|uniref:HEPN AbiU2-like domain-containing protein n=1 Tax=Vibrio owensii TaxID=696485 RepID=A0AAP9GB86_9VIBR|nr:hypothetical protein [Vibrio owensii]QGH46874.1 hypothetical protein APZ19_07150 [Vibrio owensii]